MWAMVAINVLMSLHVVVEDPLQAELLIAPLMGTFERLVLTFLMCRQMVC